MVNVRMRNDDGSHSLRDGRHQGRVAKLAIQGKADIQQDAHAFVREFDATTANLLGASVNTDPHSLSWISP